MLLVSITGFSDTPEMMVSSKNNFRDVIKMFKTIMSVKKQAKWPPITGFLHCYHEEHKT